MLRRQIRIVYEGYSEHPYSCRLPLVIRAGEHNGFAVVLPVRAGIRMVVMPCGYRSVVELSPYSQQKAATAFGCGLPRRLPGLRVHDSRDRRLGQDSVRVAAHRVIMTRLEAEIHRYELQWRSNSRCTPNTTPPPAIATRTG
jgi:hypothetical protein